MSLRGAVSGTKANRVGSPALAPAQLILGNIWSPKETGMWPHTATHPQTQCCHMGIRGQRNQWSISIWLKGSFSQATSHLQGPSTSPGPVPLVVGVLITSPHSPIKELCGSDGCHGKICSGPIHQGTGRLRMRQTLWTNIALPVSETFVP